ncbi:MAG: hypothetical protein IT419_07245 [Planctomycetes bacterium]|nr:hypothetical protein [Planctomycetota bacterium]
MSDWAITLVAASIVAVCCLWEKLHSDFVNKVRNNLRLSESIIVELPLESAREAMLDFFGSLPHSDVSETDGVSVYERGISRILRVERIMPLHSIPHVVGVGFNCGGHRTTIEIAYHALPNVKFSVAAAAYFLESARKECQGASEMFQEIASITRPGACARGFGLGGRSGKNPDAGDHR